MTIIKYDQVSLENLNYSKPEKIGPSYFGSFSYGGNLNPLYIQTPKLKCMSGIASLKDKKNPFLEVEIPKGSFDMYDFFLSLDDKNIKETLHKSEEWFQKEIPLEAIDDMYKRTTKPFKKDTNPTLKFRLPVIQNEIQCPVYNQQRVFVDLDEIKEGSEIILILHIRGIKFLKHNFYCDCYISQIKLFQDTIESKYTIMQEYALIDEEDDPQMEYDTIFNEEIVNAFEEESRLKKEKEEEEDRLKKEKEEEEDRLKKEKEDRIEKLKQEIELKHREMEELTD
jgi:hypothetical protein